MQIIFVLFELLLPFGQWAYGESRVQKIFVLFGLFVFKKILV